ncbi:LysR family transcriptional regulator [Microbacterium sp. NPDC056052]|uniref:LysR family transcriptional regulator n=1 Tax=Microbacterium sp. NPDC056052 TaxID=3345695 RepID=UPI0035DDBFC1
METRELRYFVAVAEELHFGRAAQRLMMAQPPLSRAIQQLERRLGVVLLHRTARAVTLTEAGTVLLREARLALQAVEAAESRTLRAAAPGPTLVLAAKAGASSELLSTILDAYAAEPGAVAIEVTLGGPGQPETLLRTGRADVALLQRPYDETIGLDTEDLHTEQQVLVVPADHPVAVRPHLSLAEADALADLPLPRWPEPDGSYPEGPGPQVRDHTQLLQLISLGLACAVAPESLQSQLRDGHAMVPLSDAPAVTTVIAWPPHSTSQALAHFIRTATRLSSGTRPPKAVSTTS